MEHCRQHIGANQKKLEPVLINPHITNIMVFIHFARRGSYHTFCRVTLRIMKLFTFIMVIGLLHTTAAGFSQNINLRAKGLPLTDAFKAIGKQSGYNIVCNDSIISKAAAVDLDLSGASLSEALNACLDGTQLIYEVKGRSVIIHPQLRTGKYGNLQDRVFADIRGRIVNEKGEPVAGANIKIKGTEKATITNADGFFTINAAEGDVLVVTYVEYKTKELKVSASDVASGLITINLQKEEVVMQEVVTTAYGIEKRTKEIGYSVARITGEELMRTSPSNILTGLTGRVSGLVITNMGTGMDPDNNVMLRGIRSINASANNQPLIILNGSPLSFGADQNAATLAIDFINNLNPNDIEDITVLKGANGAAIYGPEGVNGVLIINTKKGLGKRLGVNLRTSSNFQFINWKQRRIQEIFGTGDLVDDNGNPVYNPHGDMLWGPAYDGKMMPLGWPDENGELQMVPYKYTNDRQKFWNTARNTQYNLSISQSDKNSDFYLGLNYTDQTGLLPKDKQHKAGILLNTGRSFGKFSARTNIIYNYTTSDKGPQGIATDFIPPHVPLLRYKDYVNYKWADRNHYYSDELANPYEQIDNNRTKGAENALTGNLEFKLKPLPWLVVTERPGVTFNSGYKRGTSKPLYYSDYAKELGMNGRWISYQDRQASMSERTLSLLTLNNDLLLSGMYQTNNFSLKATLGNTIRQSYIKEILGSSGRLIVPVYNLAFGEQNESYVSEKSELSRFYSFFGTALVGYKDRVFVEVTGRNDRDSKLAEIARNKNFYAGINTSIVVNEIFTGMKKIKWLSNLRLRASLTRTANMNIKPYQAERLLQFMGFKYPDLIGYNYMKNVPNPLLEPENVFSQEYGANVSFLNNRISFDVAYYRQRNNGLILDVKNSTYSGAPTTDNAGIYDNRGWEFDVNLKEIVKTAGGFSANARLLLAINDNKVVELPPVYNGRLTAYVGMISVAARTGKHAFEFYGIDWKRDPQGRVIVDQYTGIPQMDYENPVFAGRTLPKYTASASIDLHYKGFSFSALGEYRGGNEQFNANGSQGMRSGQSLLTLYNNREPFVYPNSVYDDGTGKYIENKDIKISSIRDYYMQASSITSNFLINAGFFTLREVALSYDFNVKLKYIQNISAGIYGKDIWTIYAKNNIYGDPQLVRGPGSERDKGLIPWYGGQNQSNFGSAAADYDRLPGIIQYGFFMNIGF